MSKFTEVKMGTAKQAAERIKIETAAGHWQEIRR